MSKEKIEKNQSSGVGAGLAPPASVGDPAGGTQGTEVKQDELRRAGKANKPNPEEEKAWREARRRVDVMSMSHSFAYAILQNPKIDIFLYGSPLEAGTRGEHPNAGTLLAQGAKRLAEDYLNALEALHNPPVPAPMPVPGATTEIQVGDPTNDFPLD